MEAELDMTQRIYVRLTPSDLILGMSLGMVVSLAMLVSIGEETTCAEFDATIGILALEITKASIK